MAQYRRFTPEEDELILAAGIGELSIVAERLGRVYGSVKARKNTLLNPRSRPTNYKPKSEPEAPISPFARPAWFENENLLALAQARR